ncbi:Hamartin protein-domain-containing protein [Polychytrium aggregatum]|uniref:Hamartin protein-domain-containing protein n=1 Tax=Polychytrium aggregatum TaxID=110093 RepID=UPI0022FDE0CD|nr:Hamartin protein-domain-containing protein [Polychytrium aggregatum]KAI9209738.1 Hamartin protein-domain-containing protein [Polychytrium aggregatum]
MAHSTSYASTRDLLGAVAADLDTPPVHIADFSPKSNPVLVRYSLSHAYSTPTPAQPWGAPHSSIEKLNRDLRSTWAAAIAKAESPDMVREPSLGSGSLDDIAAPARGAKFIVMIRWIEALLPIMDPAQIIEDWWASVLKPILLESRWIQALNAASDLTVGLLTGCPWGSVDNPAAGSSPAHAAVAAFRATVLTAYMAEVAKVVESDPQPLSDESMATARPTLVSLSTYWETATSPLEMALIRFGQAKSKIVFELLDGLLGAKNTRIHALILLGKLIKTPDVPRYTVRDTNLSESLLESMMNDTHPVILASSTNHLASLLPYIFTKYSNIEGVKRLVRALIRVVKWEFLWNRQQYAHAGDPSATDDQASATDENIMLFKHISFVTIRAAVERYFTMLYGLFPCNMIHLLREINIGDRFEDNESWAVATDEDYLSHEEGANRHISTSLQQDIEDVDLLHEARRRFLSLFSNHQAHPNLLLHNCETELVYNLENNDSDPDRIIAECMELYNSPETRGTGQAPAPPAPQSTAPVVSEDQNTERHAGLSICTDTRDPVLDLPQPLDVDTLSRSRLAWDSGLKNPAEDMLWRRADFDSIDYIMELTKALRRHLLELKSQALVSPTMSSATSPVPRSLHMDMIKYHFYFLLNQLNVEIFMRQQYMTHIRALRREQIDRDQQQSITLAMNDKLRSQNKEINSLRDYIEQRRVELSKFTIRHRSFEEELQNRVAASRAVSEALAKENTELKKTIKDFEVSCQLLDESVREGTSRISTLEVELAAERAKTDRLQEYDETIKDLCARFSESEREIDQLLQHKAECEKLQGQVRALTVQLEDLEREATELRQAASRQAEATTTTITLMGTLEKACERYQKWIDEESRRREIIQKIGEERISAVEEKYQTVIGINQLLEGKVVDLMQDLDDLKIRTLADLESGAPGEIAAAADGDGSGPSADHDGAAAADGHSENCVGESTGATAAA